MGVEVCRYFQDMALGEGVALETRGHCVGPAEGETDCYRALAASKPGGNRTGGQGIPSNPSKRQWTPPTPTGQSLKHWETTSGKELGKVPAQIGVAL